MERDNQPSRPLRAETGVGDTSRLGPGESHRTNLRDNRACLISRIVLIRESDGSDLLLLHGMANRTIAAHLVAVPELAVLVGDPIGPVNDPRKRHQDFRLDRNTRVVTVQIESTLVVYYMGSAASRDRYGESKFGSFMAQLIGNHRPAELRSGPFTRLGRSMKTFSTLLDMVQAHRVEVFTDESHLRPWQPNDEFMWGVLAAFATQERSSIVTRTVFGKVAKAMRGGPLGADWTVPFGYHVVDDQVVADPSMRDAIREVLLLLADEKLSSSELRDRLAGLGFERKRPGVAATPERSIAAVVDAKGLRRSLINRLDLYETGVHQAEIAVPISGLESIGSVSVEYGESPDRGQVTIDCYWGLPDGGWAESWVFDAIRRAEALRRRGRTGQGRTRRPFSSFPEWIEGDFVYRIGTNDTENYRLERRRFSSLDIQVDSTGPMEEVQQSVVDHVELVGRIATDDLARAVSEATLKAVSQADGMSINLDSTVGLPADIARSRTLMTERQRARADKLRSMHARARRRSLAEEDDELAKVLLADATEYLEEARSIEATIELNESNESPDPELPSELTLDIASLRCALTVLGSTRGAVDAPIAAALRAVFGDFRIIPVSGTASASVTFSLAIPTDTSHVARLGPIATTVKISPRRTTGGPVVPISKRRVEVVELVAGGATLDQVAEQIGSLSESRVETHLREAAVDAGADPTMARIFAIAPIPELHILLARLIRADSFSSVVGGDRPTIEKMLTEKDLVDDVIDAEWGAYVLERYASAPAHHDWSLVNFAQQTALDLIAAHGGKLDLPALHHHNPDLFTPAAISRLLIGHGPWPAIVAVAGHARWSDHLHRIHEATVTHQSCPRCGGTFDKVLAVHEIPSRLLCSECRHPNEAGAPKFPTSYLHLPIQNRRRILGPRAKHAPDTVRLHADHGLPMEARTWTRRHPDDLDPEVREQLCEMYRNGEHVTGPNSICERFSVNTSLLYSVLDAAGVPRRRTTIGRTSR